MYTSTSCSLPSVVTTPVSVIFSIGQVMASVFSAQSASRKPFPGVGRRQPVH